MVYKKSEDFEHGKLIVELALEGINETTVPYFKEHPKATATALMTITKDAYIRAWGPAVTAMMFYKLADELATMDN